MCVFMIVDICVHDCRYFISIDYSKIFRSPKDDHMCCLNI